MVKREIPIGQHSLSIETGRLAKQADGSVIVRQGDTMVLVAACHSSSQREPAGVDHLDLPAVPDLGHPGDAIARDPRHVMDDRLALAEQAVEEGRLADVGPADDGDGRSQGHRGNGFQTIRRGALDPERDAKTLIDRFHGGEREPARTRTERAFVDGEKLRHVDDGGSWQPRLAWRNLHIARGRP